MIVNIPDTHEVVPRKGPPDNSGKYLAIFLAGMTLAWWLWYRPEPKSMDARTAPSSVPNSPVPVWVPPGDLDRLPVDKDRPPIDRTDHNSPVMEE